MELRIDLAMVEAATQFGTTVHKLQAGNKARDRETAAARAALWDVLVNDAKMTLRSAAAQVGIADHTTVMAALRKPRDERYQEQRKAVRRALYGERTSLDDAVTWLADWPRIRGRLRWFAGAADLEIDQVDKAMNDLRAVLDVLDIPRATRRG